MSAVTAEGSDVTAPTLTVTGCDEAICADRVTISAGGEKVLVVLHCTTCHEWGEHVACSNCGACITGKEFQRRSTGVTLAALEAQLHGLSEPPTPKYCSLKCIRLANKAAKQELEAERAEFDARVADRRRQEDQERTRRREMQAALRETSGPSSTQMPSVTSVKELVEWLKDLPGADKALTRTDYNWGGKAYTAFGSAVAYLEGEGWYGSRTTDEMREQGCGYCNGGKKWYATMCLEHAWKYGVKDHVWPCAVCGRLHLRRIPPAFSNTHAHTVFEDGQRIWDRKPVYCDDICRGVAVSDQRARVRAENRNGLKCEQCGEIIDASRKDARYCSPRCRQKAYRGRRSA